MYFRIALFAGLAIGLAAYSEPAAAQTQSAPAELSRSIDRTRQVLEAYWKDHDPKYVAEDAVFVMMPTGEEIRGRDAIAKHINGFYHGALDARAEVVNGVFGENEGLLEAMVVGKHTGAFAGIPATGRDVKVPISVAYELDDGLIKKARIYLMVNVLMQQIGPAPAAP